MRTLDNKYYEWLLDIIGIEEPPHYDYRLLMRDLHKKEYVWVLPDDENRYDDGLELRDNFLSMFPNNYETLANKPCSVLEMLIAMAIRCENDIMYDPSVGNRTSEWFWIMIENLGLEEMTDDNYNSHQVDRIIRDFMMRRYERNGFGSIFFCDSKRKDFRKVSLWYQMCFYLNEHYTRTKGV